MKRFNVVAALFIVALLFNSSCTQLKSGATNVRLPSLFTDNMVLQKGVAVPVWGTADPGGKVKVSINGQSRTAVVKNDSSWRVDLRPLEYGGPFEMLVTGATSDTIRNVMVGEVWVASGQSNMQFALSAANNGQQEISSASYDKIRLLQLERVMDIKPQTEVPAEGWEVCSPETVGKFSAVAYFFGRHLYNQLQVPIGLIHTSWGGTPAEAWTSAGALKTLPDFAPIIAEMDSAGISEEELMKQFQEKMDQWTRALDSLMNKDNAFAEGWKNPDYNDSEWSTMSLPVLWENAGLAGFDGVVRFRKSVVLSRDWAETELVLRLGPIDDVDITYFNGKQIGTTDQYNRNRKYTVPADLVKDGENVIAVQVLDFGGGGGIWGQPNQMKLVFGENSMPLAGDWKYRVGISIKEAPPRPRSPLSPHRPTVLYNAMIHPLIPYAIQGAIWYQGESNASRAYQYRSLFQTMITDWRTQWGQGDFPFLFVQLANFKQRKSVPVDDDWAELREAQTMALDLPNTGMAVTIDIGEADDIHPKNKQDVGKRLALNALKIAYGQDIVYSGPMYKSMTIIEDKVRIAFDHVGGGLVAKGGTLLGFAIAGEDSSFTWADAEIDGETVVVSSPYVVKPVAVRYGWASNPLGTLYNKEGLPASPFRTDDWPGITWPKSGDQ